MSQNEGDDHCTKVASTRDNRSVDWAWFQLGEILAEIANSSTQRESGESYLLSENAFQRNALGAHFKSATKSLAPSSQVPLDDALTRGVEGGNVDD
jgi:hypothetical protein